MTLHGFNYFEAVKAVRPELLHRLEPRRAALDGTRKPWGGTAAERARAETCTGLYDRPGAALAWPWRPIRDVACSWACSGACAEVGLRCRT